MTALDRRALVDELLDRLGAGARSSEAGVVEALVDDWAREADPMPDPSAVLRFQREDLEHAIAHAGDVRGGLRLALLQRRVNRVSAATLAVARARREGDQSVASHARDLLREVEALADELDDAPPSARGAVGPLRVALGESMLDARFALEGSGATSLRLGHDPTPPAADDPGPPPDLRP